MTRIPPSLQPARGPVVHAMAEAPAPGSSEQLALAVVESLSRLSDQLRQVVSDAAWESIPSYVQEYGRSDALAAGGLLTVTPEFADLVLIERAVVCIPAGSTGTLQLGADLFPNLPAGVTSLLLGKVLFATDARTLTLAAGSTGGQATVSLYGRQLAPTGSMAP